MDLIIRDDDIKFPTIRTYSRDFLLRLQFTPYTIRKPAFHKEEPGIVFYELVHDPEEEYNKLTRTTKLSDDDDEYMMDTTDNNHSRGDIPPTRHRGRRPRGNRGGRGRGSTTANENGQPMYNIPIYEDGKEISRETTNNDRPTRGRGRGRGRNSFERGRHHGHRSNSRHRRDSLDNVDNFGNRRSNSRPRRDSVDSVDNVLNRRRNSSVNVLESTETENVPSNDTEKRRRGRIFGYKLLKELAESDRSPDLLAFELLDTKGGFEELISKEEINVDWMILLMQILARIIETQQKQTLIDLLNVLYSKKFFESQMIPMLNKISMNSINITDISTFVHNVFMLCKTALERLPEEFLSPCNLVLVLLQHIVQRIPDSETTTGFTVSEDVHELKLLLEAVRIEEKKNAIDEAANKRRRHLLCEDLPPPDDFRELAILPALKDLDFNQRPFLRVNKVEGSYDDLDHYLDVQFRLLREDYVQPLRNGILQYRIEKEQGKYKKLQDIRLYEKVHIVRSACSNDGILHVLQFDVSKMTKVRWESSKRLLYGSLVCLSPDDFETMYFATVTNRDTKELTNGFIQVRFEQNFEELREIGPSESFIMAETTAYFEAYRHTLRGLQQIDGSMPFQSYIVKCQTTMKPPKYLLKGRVIQYDFEPLVKSGKKELNCPVINIRRWPTASEMNLDESQYRALQLAITKELAIIQGPPGTGKTYIGLKIAELLLHNTSVWNEDKELNPILIVCYTNHALDQFLEGILEFCTSVVRIGGRCNSDKLERYKLSKYRMTARRSLSKSVTLTIQKRKYDCKRQMSKERDQIEETNIKLYTTRFGIMNESILKKYIQENHFRSMCSGHNGEASIIQWLGIETNSKIGFSEFNEDITATDPLLSTWKKTILEYGNQMELKDVLTVNDIWGLPLEKRVQLYKYLTILVRRRLENNIFEARNSRMQYNYGNIQQDIEAWSRNLEYIENNILNEDQLLTYIPDNFKPLVMNMKSKKPTPLFSRTNQTVTEQWLCLDGTEESRQNIRKTMKALDNDEEFIDVEEEATIVEQERKIEDDDDFLENEGRQNKPSHVELDDLAMVAFKTTSNDADVEEEGDWITVKSKEKQKKLIRKILFGKGTFSDNEIANIGNIWELSFDEKAKLYRSWLSKYQIELKKSIEDCERRYANICQSYREAMDMEDAELIRNTKVVAMTTTGAAKFRVILQTIKPRIIIVEEAAEVLESHIVTALNENCQHLILIGDHKQLRPSPTVYQLATKYNLEISLFERMIKNEINYETLELQHRMRPEISVLMQHIYPELKDHPSVLRRSNILGLDNNIFFITHQQQEQHSEETRSRSNIHEAKFAVELCRYFMNQGYEPQQITILAAYSGQIFQLRKLMPKTNFNGVRVTAVDNFQGEENDIIILSLVRSNQDNSIGFLSIDNRVCVALSRARRGFYIIGNVDLLAYNSSLWASIESTLKEKQAIGPQLRLRCQNHRDKVTIVSKAEDFSRCRGGGCDKLCEARLKCGHACKKTCHIVDKDHIRHKCTEICGKTTCPAGHTCKKKCYQDCGPCSEPVQKKHPVCNHNQIMPCHTDPHLFICQDVCRKRLPCGHECQGVCGTCSKEHAHKLCKLPCKRKLLCGHIVDMECSAAVENYKCPHNCEYTLGCGHRCKGTCGDCFGGKFHVPCQEKCKAVLICGHICNQNCGKPCQTCPKACPVNCQHSKCQRKCGFPCTACKEKCGYSCKHESCSKLCGELCNRLPCSYKCPKTLPCKHKCMGLCGETCPAVCFQCDPSKAKNIYQYCTRNTKFVVLEDCGHIFESTSMDDWVFERDTGKGVFIEMLRCPQCRKPITNSKRYGRFIDTMKESVNKIKSSLNITNSNFTRRKVEITTRLQEGKRLDQTFIDKVLSCLEDQTHLTMEELDCLENQIILLSCLGHMSEILDQNSKLILQQPHEVKEINQCIDKAKRWVLNMRVKPNKTSGFKLIPRKYFTVLELEEIKYEILRVDFIVQYLLLLQHGIDSTWMDSVTKGDVLETIQTIIDTKKCLGSDNFTWSYKFKRLHREAGSTKPTALKLPTRARLVESRTFVERKWCKCSCGNISEFKMIQPPDKHCTISCHVCKQEVVITSINDVPFIVKKNNETEFEENPSPEDANEEPNKRDLKWKTVQQYPRNSGADENKPSRLRSEGNEVDLNKKEDIDKDDVSKGSRKEELQTSDTNGSAKRILEWKTVETGNIKERTKIEMPTASLNRTTSTDDGIKNKQRWTTVRQTSVETKEQGQDILTKGNPDIDVNRAISGEQLIRITDTCVDHEKRAEPRWKSVNQNADTNNGLKQKIKNDNEDELAKSYLSNMTTTEYENTLTDKSSNVVRPKSQIEKSDMYLRQSSFKEENMLKQPIKDSDSKVTKYVLEKLKDVETDKLQYKVGVSDTRSYAGDFEPNISQKQQRFMGSAQSNYIENSKSGNRRLTEEMNKDAKRERTVCGNGHVYSKNHDEPHNCLQCNISSSGTRPKDNIRIGPSILKNSEEHDIRSKDNPKIVERKYEQRRSSGVFKCRNGHAFAMNSEFAKNLEYSCPDCGKFLYRNEDLEQIEPTEYRSNIAAAKPDGRHSSAVYDRSDKYPCDTLNYDQTPNQPSESKQTIVSSMKRDETYRDVHSGSTKRETGKPLSETGSRYSERVKISEDSSLITEGLKFVKNVFSSKSEDQTVKTDHAGGFQNVKERQIVSQQRPDAESVSQSTEKEEGGKKNIYMWFRCSKGHLYNKERGDPDRDGCTKCGDKEGSSLI